MLWLSRAPAKLLAVILLLFALGGCAEGTADTIPAPDPTSAVAPSPTSAPTSSPTSGPTPEPSPAPAPEPSPAPTEEPLITVAETMENPDYKGISLRHYYIYVGEHSYRASEGEKKLPLVLWLDWAKGRADPGNDALLLALENDEINPACIVVSPYGSRYPASISSVEYMDFIDYICSLYPVDADRISVIGWSSGAWRAAMLIAEYPEVFSAAVIMADTRHAWAQGYERIKLPVEIITGSLDRYCTLYWAESIAGAINDNGGDCQYRYIEGYDHKIGLHIFTDENYRLLDWLTDQARGQPRVGTIFSGAGPSPTPDAAP